MEIVDPRLRQLARVAQRAQRDATLDNVRAHGRRVDRHRPRGSTVRLRRRLGDWRASERRAGDAARPRARGIVIAVVEGEIDLSNAPGLQAS